LWLLNVTYNIASSHLAKNWFPTEASRAEPGYYLDWRETPRKTVEELLVRPAGGADPVVCVGSKAPV